MRALVPAIMLSALTHAGVIVVLLAWPGALVEGPAPIVVELIVQAPADPVAASGASPVESMASRQPAIPAAAPAGPAPPEPAVEAAEIAPPAPVQPPDAMPLRPARKPRAPAAAAPAEPAAGPPVTVANRTEASPAASPDTGGLAAPAAPAMAAAASTGIAGDAPVDRAAVPQGDNPPPVYPPRARREGLEGRVVLRVAVAADGTAHEVGIHETSGHALLDRAAMAAVERWRFRPARQDGRAVAGMADVTVRFVLTD